MTRAEVDLAPGLSAAELVGALSPDAWTVEALCAQSDPDAWWPEKGGSARLAVRICQGCPVRHKCLELALARPERAGIWGGTTPNQRRRMARERDDPTLFHRWPPGDRKRGLG